jgi:flagellar basal body rod protein FlgC
MSDVYSIALGGIHAATKRFEASATRVAQDPHADLAAEFVDQKFAELAFKANVVVLKTANQMSKALLDILV